MSREQIKYELLVRRHSGASKARSPESITPIAFDEARAVRTNLSLCLWIPGSRHPSRLLPTWNIEHRSRLNPRSVARARNDDLPYTLAFAGFRASSARSGNACASAARVAAITPRSVIKPVISRAGVTSNP